MRASRQIEHIRVQHDSAGPKGGRGSFSALNRKALESSLVEMAFTGRVIVRVISLSMCRCPPSEHSAHGTVPLGAKHKMPVIGHEAECKQLDRVLFKTLSDHAKKSLVVVGQE